MGLRVLTVIETLGGGGAEQSLASLLPALADLGVECEVAVLRPPMTLRPTLEERGIVVHDLRLRHRWDLRGVARLRRLALARHTDVLHGHLFFGGLYVAASRPFLRRVARVVTFHNLGYDSFPADTAWRRVRKRLDALLMRHAIDQRLAVSGAVADHYRRHLGLATIDVVPNGLDVRGLAGMRSGDRRKLGRDPSAPTIVALGRLVPEKSHDVLIDAMARVVVREPAAQLAVIGDGPQRGRIEAAVSRAGLNGSVRLLGQLSHDDALSLVATADVFVSTSSHEGFGLALAEAMALGLPVVATDVGGVRELVGDAGVLVSAGDPSSLADGILALLGDRGRLEELGRLGRERVATKFDLDAVAAQLRDSYVTAWSHVS